MTRPADVVVRRPEDFASVLATAEPVLVVGGQAVNLWALAYPDRTAELAPFTSRDVDILGDVATLAELGRLAGVRPQRFPFRPPTNEVGVVIARDRSDQPMLVQVLRHVHGATNVEISDPAYTMALGPRQVKVRVPGPIALFQAKLANVTGLNQAGRQDGRHVVILSRVIPAYLDDLQAATRDGRLEERQLLDFLEQLLRIVTLKKNLQALGNLSIDPRELFASLKPQRLPKLRAFLEKRLPRRL